MLKILILLFKFKNLTYLIMNFEDLSKQCLCFPETYYDNKNLTIEEENNAEQFILEILNKRDSKNFIKKPYCNHLIKTIALANRKPRCRIALEYILTKFKKYLIPSYISAYNLVFMGATVFDGVLGAKNRMDIVSQVLYRKNFDKLDEENRIECHNFAICIREIFAISQLIKSDLHFGGRLYITNLYNLLDKFNYIFKRLFGFRVFDVFRKLTPHRYARHAVAHSHYVFNKIDEKGIGKLKIVHWEKQKDGKFVVKGYLEDILGITTEETRQDMLYLSVIIC
ncbi:hypothetical protein LCGC14_2470070, partial [marine sediment metagenome]